MSSPPPTLRRASVYSSRDNFRFNLSPRTRGGCTATSCYLREDAGTPAATLTVHRHRRRFLHWHIRPDLTVGVMPDRRGGCRCHTVDPGNGFISSITCVSSTLPTGQSQKPHFAGVLNSASEVTDLPVAIEHCFNGTDICIGYTPSSAAGLNTAVAHRHQSMNRR